MVKGLNQFLDMIIKSHGVACCLNVHNILVMSLNLIIFIHLAVSDNVTPTLFL